MRKYIKTRDQFINEYHNMPDAYTLFNEFKDGAGSEHWQRALDAYAESGNAVEASVDFLDNMEGWYTTIKKGDWYHISDELEEQVPLQIKNES